MQHYDVIIVGAGLSGIAAAYYLQRECPARSFTILEARSSIGGTWDLFRYPGVRSDSDMYTLGYSFFPWPNAQAIADGPTIRDYLHTTAQTYGLDRAIRFQQRVRHAAWSSATARWTLEVISGPDAQITPYTCNFLFMCTGYYEYAQGYTPEWPGRETFTGPIIHPQHWPADLEYANKRIIVIGSGATAVTLVPALAKHAAHVTMLQRSPTYIAAQPTRNPSDDWLRDHLPPRLGHLLVRWKHVLVSAAYYHLMRWQPARARRSLIRMMQAHLPPGYDVATHFSPRYDPWDQRLCLAPDGDIFAAIRAGRATVVTDQIDHVTPNGIALRSGQILNADIIVTATGLIMRLMSGIALEVDGRTVDLARTLSYRGTMFSDVPNLALAMGYTNASWTLKCELSAQYICRLLNYMQRHGYAQCTPRRDAQVRPMPVINFTSGYVQRALAELPQQGSRHPWKLYQNYLLDIFSFRFGRLRDQALEFRSVKRS
jgi:cation diffusion facilitator CzcD-associated flavoprotein CzcO